MIEIDVTVSNSTVKILRFIRNLKETSHNLRDGLHEKKSISWNDRRLKFNGIQSCVICVEVSELKNKTNAPHKT